MSINNNKPTIKKNWLSLSNIVTAVLMAFVVLMLFSPDTKAKVIEGLMKIGLFQPNIPSNTSKENAVASIADGVIFKDQYGNDVRLADQKGKVVFINFWATWCPPCIAEMPSVNVLHEKYKNDKNVIFLIVNVDGKVSQSVDFMKKRNLSLPVHIPSTQIPAAYFSGSLPTTIVLDKLGKIAFQHVGGADYSNENVYSFINELSQSAIN